MTPISTQNLTSLPNIEQLRKLLQSMAALDAILCPEWDYRYYSFNSAWADGEMMGSMRDGQGDEFFALFNRHGCFIKGLGHDSPLTEMAIDPAEHYRNLPAEFQPCVNEPAFASDQVTFCIWRGADDSLWSWNAVPLPPGNDPDGSAYLLSALDGKPETYSTWAESYYERDVPLPAVEAIYRHQPLTDDIVQMLNDDIELEALKDELQEIGYCTTVVG